MSEENHGSHLKCISHVETELLAYAGWTIWFWYFLLKKAFNCVSCTLAFHAVVWFHCAVQCGVDKIHDLMSHIRGFVHFLVSVCIASLLSGFSLHCQFMLRVNLNTDHTLKWSCHHNWVHSRTRFVLQDYCIFPGVWTAVCHKVMDRQLLLGLWCFFSIWVMNKIMVKFKRLKIKIIV